MLRRAWVPFAFLLLASTAARTAPESVLGALETEIQAIVERAAPAVVRVEARKKSDLGVDRNAVPGALVPSITETSVGAGFVVGAERFILAGYAVVADAEEIRVTYHDGLTVEAEVVDSNAFFRVAVLRASEMSEELRPLELSDREPRPGSFAILCGRAHDAGPSVRLGLLCDTRCAYLGFDRFLVVSASLTPGESGAPFLGSDGRVVGLGSASLTDRRVTVRFGPGTSGFVRGSSASSPGRLACCVPASDLRRVLADVTRHGRIQQAWLGVTLRSEEPVITGVVERSPAEGAALMPGDRVRSLDGEEIGSRMQLVGLLARLRPQTVATFRIVRDGKERDVKVPLLLRPRMHERDLLREQDGIRIMRVPESCRCSLIRTGDLIVAVNDAPAIDPAIVLAALAGFEEADPVGLVVERGGKRFRVSNR